MFDTLRVLPGAPAAIAQRDPGDRLGFTDKAAAALRHRELLEQAAAAAEPAVGRAAAQPAVGAAGHGCVRQGRCHSHRVLRREPTGHDGSRRSRRPPGARPRTTTCGACTRCVRCTVRSASSTARTTRTCSRCRVRSLAPERCGGRGFRHIREFERMLARRGHDRREGVPAHLARRAAPTPPGAHRRSRRSVGSSAARTSTTAPCGSGTRRPTRRRSPRPRPKWSPWFVVPSDRKWVRTVAVAELLVDALEKMDPQLPTPSPRSPGSRRIAREHL